MHESSPPFFEPSLLPHSFLSIDLSLDQFPAVIQKDLFHEGKILLDPDEVGDALADLVKVFWFRFLPGEATSLNIHDVLICNPLCVSLGIDELFLLFGF